MPSTKTSKNKNNNANISIQKWDDKLEDFEQEHHQTFSSHPGFNHTDAFEEFHGLKERCFISFQVKNAYKNEKNRTRVKDNEGRLRTVWTLARAVDVENIHHQDFFACDNLINANPELFELFCLFPFEDI